MAWIYLRESVGSQLLLENGSDQSPIAKVIAIARASYCPECNQVTLIGLQSGTMCELSKQRCSQQSTSSTAGFHARTLARQDMAAAWRESEADYFSRSCVSSEKRGQRLFFLRTSQQSEPADLERSSQLWPKNGMTVGGRCYPLRKSELYTNEKDGSYLPTPTASTYGSNQGGAAGRTGKKRLSLETMAKKNLWPTPCARDWKSESIATGMRRNTPSLPTRVRTSTELTGQLNPMWVEGLMNYPIGWTEVRPDYLRKK